MRLYCFGNSHLWTIFDRYLLKSDERMEHTDGDLELVGWKLGSSGATAYGLLKHDSSSGAGAAIPRHLDNEPGTKDVLLVFGETDVCDHIGRHGGLWEDELDAALQRYRFYVRILSDRPDVRRILVASMVPRKPNFRYHEFIRLQQLTLEWNRRLMLICKREGWSYVDWHDSVDALDGSLNGVVDPSLTRHPEDEGDCHLSVEVRPALLRKVRESLAMTPNPEKPPADIAVSVAVTPDQRRVLWKVLERDHTAAVIHGGLQGLLSLSGDEAATLIGFLRSTL